MLFRTRKPPHLLSRLRVAVWPRHSWSRSARYFTKRVMRVSGSPHAVAAGVAAGAFASFTPFIGFHFILGFIIALLIGGNLLAAALGTAIGNPLTFPLIWTLTYKLGNLILGAAERAVETNETSASIAEKSVDTILPIVGPMVVGAVPLGLPTALVLYFVVRYGVRGVQTMRRERLLARQRDRVRSAAAASIREGERV